MRVILLSSVLFLLVLELASALIRPGYGAWYDVNRPTYYDPETGQPYEWGTFSGQWMLVPRPVGHTYNPLFLEGANAYYPRLPGQDPLSKARIAQKSGERKFFYGVEKHRDVRGYLALRRVGQ